LEYGLVYVFALTIIGIFLPTSGYLEPNTPILLGGDLLLALLQQVQVCGLLIAFNIFNRLVVCRTESAMHKYAKVMFLFPDARKRRLLRAGSPKQQSTRMAYIQLFLIKPQECGLLPNRHNPRYVTAVDARIRLEK